jgi:uncharacterized membrane protein HdeD (DUF308 family)
MNVARLETWIWVLIYGGLLLVGFGLALLRAGATWGWVMVVIGVAAAVAGVVMIWLRSRIPALPPAQKPPRQP